MGSWKREAGGAGFAMSARPGYRVAVGAVAAALACESPGAHVTGPRGAEAFERYVSIGTGLSMGVQSFGVHYLTQEAAWPAQLARAAGRVLAQPLFRSPGCTPPLAGPLRLARWLSGASAAQRDSSCGGAFESLLPPLDNLALDGATAWAALTITPRTVAAAPARYDAGDRARYPLVLGSTQSQVTAMLVRGPTFVSVELGLSEVLRAATTGLLEPARSYLDTGWTYVPAAVFAPVYAMVADSVKKSGAPAVLVSVPRILDLPAFRPSAEMWADRAALAAAGVMLAADCASSANVVFTPAVVPALAARALTAPVPQTFSCGDAPGAADFVLTPADVSALGAVSDQMNAQIRALAEANGWAFADLAGFVSAVAAVRAPYSVVTELDSACPYGPLLSLDGVHPSAAGERAIAAIVARAVNARYGFRIPVPDEGGVGQCGK